MISIKLDKKTLDFIKTYPGELLWLDFQEESGKMGLSDEKKRTFYQTEVSYVQESKDS
jgi:hypothetical protein